MLCPRNVTEGSAEPGKLCMLERVPWTIAFMSTQRTQRTKDTQDRSTEEGGQEVKDTKDKGHKGHTRCLAHSAKTDVTETQEDISDIHRCCCVFMEVVIGRCAENEGVSIGC